MNTGIYDTGIRRFRVRLEEKSSVGACSGGGSLFILLGILRVFVLKMHVDSFWLQRGRFVILAIFPKMLAPVTLDVYRRFQETYSLPPLSPMRSLFRALCQKEMSKFSQPSKLGFLFTIAHSGLRESQKKLARIMSSTLCLLVTFGVNKRVNHIKLSVHRRWWQWRELMEKQRPPQCSLRLCESVFEFYFRLRLPFDFDLLPFT